MDHILYQVFKTILSIFKKKQNEKADSASIWIYVNKIENRITIKIKTGNHLELLTPETMELLGSIENKITNCENVPHLKFTEVILAHCNIVNNDYVQDRFKSFIYKCSKQIIWIIARNFTNKF